MFDTTTQTRVFNSLMTAAVSWIGKENANCAASVLTMTEQLPLTSIERARLNRIVAIFDMTFPETPYKSLAPSLESAHIPEKFTIDNETQYAYVAITTILNFTEAGLFNEGAATLLDMSSEWRELYVKATSQIADTDRCEEFCRWCALQSTIAMDIKKSNFLDFGNFAAMYDENGFSDVVAKKRELSEDDE